MVAGTDVAGDATVAGVRVTSTLDSSTLFEHLRRTPYDDLRQQPLVNIYGIGNKTGLGVQAFFGKGFDHKPMAESTFVRLYEPHSYSWRQQARWPWWRSPVELYKWGRGATGLLTDQHHPRLAHPAGPPYGHYQGSGTPPVPRPDNHRPPPRPHLPVRPTEDGFSSPGRNYP